jgi:hypothetical protein
MRHRLGGRRQDGHHRGGGGGVIKAAWGEEVEAEVVVTARGAGERVEVIGVALGPPRVVVGPLGIPV